MCLKKSELSGLKEEIKGLADRGRSVGRTVSSLRGPERAAARGEKAGIGDVARAHLLAYALLRGVPYEAVEKNVDVGKVRGLVSRVADVVLLHGRRPESPDSEVLGWMRGGAP